MAATQTTRRYVSPVREGRKEQTRSAIVEAAAGVLAAQPPELHMPSVASAAGVGVATVYRHFSSREDLLDAVYEHWMADARPVLEAMPADRDGFLDRLADLWRAQSSDEGLERAMSLSSPAGLSARRRRLGRRRDAATRLVADVHTGTEVEGRSLRAAVLLLTSTTAHRHLREYWAMTTDEAAATAAWAVWTLIAGARQPH
jgi:AcrR family transcriptional regulator